LPGKGEEAIKRMADALRSGAKMLSEVCPVCNSPLFEIKGEMRCIACDKPVILVKDESESSTALMPMILSDLNYVLLSKIEELTTKLSRAIEIDEITSISTSLNALLTLFQKSYEIKQRIKQEERAGSETLTGS